MKLKQIALTITTLMLTFMVAAVPVFATRGEAGSETDFNDGIGICDFIGPICDALGISDSGDPTGAAVDFVRNRLTLGISFLFLGIILISVYIIVKNGLKYIRSQGEEGEIKDAQKAIKSVFLGIGVLFVGIIGIILVLAFFNAGGLFNSGVDSEGNDLIDVITGDE